ncbi:MAG: S8 family serine peptidase [Dehalococcoidia bacterium]
MRWLLLAIVACAGMALPWAATPVAVFAQDVPQADGVIVQYRMEGPRQAVADARAEPATTAEGFVRVRVPAGVSRDAFLAELRSDPAVVRAEPDAPVYAAASPNDPFYLQTQSGYFAQIAAQQAWDLMTNAAPVVVAVLDSGIDLDHEDFAGRLWTNEKDATADGVDDDNNGCVDDHHGCRFVELTSSNRAACGYSSSAPTGNVGDDHGAPGASEHSHGTLVAGILGAAGNNAKGVAGVAWNVRIMPIKVLDCGSFGGLPRGSMFNVAEGIAYARQMGAKIINLSIASEPGDQSADNAKLRLEIERAQAAGIIIVAAAGNHLPGSSKVGPGYPAAYTQYTNVVAVGAAGRTLQWATYSNYGPAIDFAAPGDEIVGPVRTALAPQRPYAVGSRGTSLAAPLVSGMFALMMARNPELPAADYVSQASQAATPPAPAPHGQNWAGAGVINIGQAVARVPMTLAGDALREWRDAPPGTEVRAFVGGVDCGATSTVSVGPVARYSLRVRSELETAGCGAPGKTVQLLVGGFPALPTVPWGLPESSLAVSNLDVSSVPPAPGPIVVQTLNGGWSNIAYLDPAGLLPAVLTSLPSPWTNVFAWDAEKASFDVVGAYRHFSRGAPTFVNDLPELQRYQAIWIDAGAANAATANPNPPPGLKVTLKAGWNNVVWTGTSAPVGEALASIAGKYQQVLQYDNVARAWHSYLPGRQRLLNDFGGLFKLKVYWILMTEDAELTMP